MKKITVIIMALAFVLGMAQCRKHVETIAQPAGGTVDVTVRVENGSDKTDITATGVVTWKQGDKIYIVGETQGLLGYVSALSAGDPVNFAGSITAISSAQTLKFYYVGDKTFTLDGSGNYTFGISGQDGSLAGIAAYNQMMFGKTTGTVPAGTTDLGTINMNSVMAIAHLNIHYGGSAVSGPVTVTGGFASATFNAKTYAGEMLSGTAGDMTMTFATGTTSTNCYIALLPGAQTLTFMDAGGKMARFSEKTIAVNGFYNAGNAIEVATHEYVDLGLPSGLLWATCNLGATNGETAESWYGDYYQWGGVTPVTLTDINVGWAGCPHTNGTYSVFVKKVFTKYVPQSQAWTYGYQGFYDDKTVLDAGDDAATQEWGSAWRMPTETDFFELINNTNRTWYAEGNTEFNGVAGWKCVSTKAGYTDKYIFLPAAGYRSGTSLNNAGSNGVYWSSSLFTSTPERGSSLGVSSSDFNLGVGDRCSGFSVRPVCLPQN